MSKVRIGGTGPQLNAEPFRDFWAMAVTSQLTLPPAEFSPGVRTFHGFETDGLVVVLDGADSRFVGFLSDGTLELDAASPEVGAPVRGCARGGGCCRPDVRSCERAGGSRPGA